MARIAVKAAVALVVLFLASIFFLITIFCSVNVASKRNEGNVTSEDITPEMFDPDAAIDPSFFDNSVQMDFIITAYFPDSPDDPYGGNDTCADGTKYWRDPNTPPERNLFALTPDQRVIQGVCAIVQDMHAPQVPWSLKDLVKLGVPAY
ncbi:MAG: hypothetical protein KJ907_07900, partial [Actinobacteria bacterium]|nr:hypothetical protein [Actinomycetota bacterium]